MDTSDLIRLSTASPGTQASFVASRHGGLALVEPLTEDARGWLLGYASAEASWDDDALVIEMRYFSDFVDAAIGDGHTFLPDLPHLSSGAEIDEVMFDSDMMRLKLSDEVTVDVLLDWYLSLYGGSPEDRLDFEIKADRRAIYWPRSDTDIHLDGILRGAKCPEWRRSGALDQH